MRSQHPYISELRAQLRSGRIERREFLRTATLLGVSAVSAYAMAGVAEPAAAQTQPAPGGRIRVCMRVGDVSKPHSNSSVEASNVIRQVCEYLTRTGQDNITRPYLLERWEASADLKTWTLFIRPGVRWHSGRAFTADDAVWNLKRVLDPATGSSVLGLMKSYMCTETTGADGKKTTQLWAPNAIEKVDDHTVRLNCKEAQLAVPEHLFHYPLHMLDLAENGAFKVGANGTGPFQLTGLATGSRATLQAVPNYWGTQAKIGTLEFIDLGGDPAAWVAALASSQIDGLYELDIAQLGVVSALPTVTIYKTATAQTGVARVKYDQPPFNDKRVRQALKLAIDPQKVLSLIFGENGSVGENHHVAPVHPEYAKLPTVPPDPAKAKQLLAEAGHPNGLDLEITCRNSPVWEANAVTVMAEQWAAVGIRVKINNVPTSVFWDGWLKVPFGFTSWAHRPLGVMTLDLAYRSNAQWNESSYSNPEFDDLLTQADGILDPDKRRVVMAKVEALLQDDGPIVQPLWRNVQTAYGKHVTGFRPHPTQYIFGEELSLVS